MSQKKKSEKPERFTEEDLEAMQHVAAKRRNPELLERAFDRVTGGRYSASLTNAGGKREGAGRPALPPDQVASERLMMRLTPAALARVEACAKDGEKKGTVAKRLLLERVAQVEKEGEQD